MICFNQACEILTLSSDVQSQLDSQSSIASSTTSSVHTTSTSTISTSSIASATCSGVKSGRTGIACVSCNQTGPINGDYVVDTGSYPTTFNELCNVDMPAGSATYDATTNSASTSKSVKDISAVMSYSFVECMTQCKSKRCKRRMLPITKSVLHQAQYTISKMAILRLLIHARQ